MSRYIKICKNCNDDCKLHVIANNECFSLHYCPYSIKVRKSDAVFVNEILSNQKQIMDMLYSMSKQTKDR